MKDKEAQRIIKQARNIIEPISTRESSPAPLDDDTLLWDIIGDMLFPTVIPKWKDKVRQFKSKFILTRRTEGKGRTEGDLQE